MTLISMGESNKAFKTNWPLLSPFSGRKDVLPGSSSVDLACRFDLLGKLQPAVLVGVQGFFELLQFPYQVGELPHRWRAGKPGFGGMLDVNR
ncbi:MAG TPA: hypothetical protein VJ673_05780 [Aromatoleum sp.]|uniref:hypothetical protein n=1 Tax=Aromatoleum sp. TaxID=2307007 RepID=UPI002B489814|nr:hypothetical protein [Aromatoleum sp.]HJV25174.1 hypothetical protein [Aromatoleum sp.]